jgi:hypothetical protein
VRTGGLGQSSTLALTLVVTLISALVTGAVIVALLPALSGCNVSMGTAILASFIGQLIPFVGGLLISHAVTDNRSARPSAKRGQTPFFALAAHG